jgi:hypothetical protein
MDETDSGELLRRVAHLERSLFALREVALRLIPRALLALPPEEAADWLDAIEAPFRVPPLAGADESAHRRAEAAFGAAIAGFGEAVRAEYVAARREQDQGG